MVLAAPMMQLGPLAGVERLRHDEVGAPAAGWSLRKRAVLLGNDDPQFCSLLSDVLRDIQIDVVSRSDDGGEPDVVLASVDRVNGVRAIVEARERFSDAPLLAILPLGTHRLATRAIAAGAQACYMLDMPIDRLRGLLLALLR